MVRGRPPVADLRLNKIPNLAGVHVMVQLTSG
jgi:hypothetical protein